MVAIVSGNSLGLSNTSLTALGSQGGVGNAVNGRNGERIYLDAANGNLVLQNRDDLLAATGLDIESLRTYNSQGLLDDDNGDNWKIGFYKQVNNLTGVVNTVGSTVTRVDGDGNASLYSYEAAYNLYRTFDGDGAHDTLSFSSATQTWTWTNGTTQVTESYDAANAGRLTQTRDTNGNGLTYTYAGALLSKVVSASGETTFLDYSGNNLTQLRSVSASGSTLIRTRYSYDASNRLYQVITDLSPDDASIADGNTYTTTYAYDGASKRVANIAQSDGTSVTFTYIQDGGAWKVKTFTDALNHTTTFDYLAETPAQVVASANPATLVATGLTQTITRTLNTASTQTTNTVPYSLVPSKLLNTNSVPYALNSSLLLTENVSNSLNSAALTPAGWGASSQLMAVPGSVVYAASVGMDAAGNGVAVWDYGTDIYAQRYVDNVWQAPVTLDSSPYSPIRAPNLYVDQASGNAIATWVQGPSIYAARFINGAWEAAQVIHVTDFSAYEIPTATINANGKAAVTWTQANNGFNPAMGDSGFYVSRFDGAQWQASPTLLSSFFPQSQDASRSTNRKVTMDAVGNVTVVWSQIDGSYAYADTNVMTYSVASASWSAATKVVTGSTYGAAGAAQVGFDAAGNATVMFASPGGATAGVYARNLVNGVWGAVTTLSTVPYQNLNLYDLYVDTSGNAIASWVDGNNQVSVARYVGGVWQASQVVGSAVSQSFKPSASINASGEAAVAWEYANYPNYQVQLARFSPASGWSAPTNLSGGSYAYSSVRVSIDKKGSIAATWVQDWAQTRTQTAAIYDANSFYTVAAGATWASIATALYGNANVGDELQIALGNPSLTTGKHLTGLPPTLKDRTPLPPYYVVQAGNTWSSIATALYGSANVADELQAALGNPSLTVGAHLTGLPATLNDSVTVAPYYLVKAGDTWSSIATYLYNSANVGNELQTALGNPALTLGLHLGGIPAVLNDVVTVAPYYSVKTGDTWSSIAVVLYGNADVASLLASALGSPALGAGVRLSNLPASLSYTQQISVPTYYLVLQGDTYESIALKVYGDQSAGSALKAVMGNVALTTGLPLYVPATLSYSRLLPFYPGQTTVTDPLGYRSIYSYDTKGQLIEIVSPPVNGVSTARRFVYGGAGNVLKISDIEVRSVDMGSRRDVNGAGWLHDGIGTSNYASATDGTFTASRLQSTASPYVATKATTVTSPAGKTYKVTATVKGNGGPASFQLLLTSTGTVNYFSADFSVGTDWQKITFTQTFSAADTGALLTGFKKNSLGAAFDLLISDVTVEEISGTENAVDFRYDANGNQLLQIDALGNTITRAFSSRNELLTETAYRIPDADGFGVKAPGLPLTTSYVYDAQSRLRYTISAAGRVSEFQYYSTGERKAAIQYTGALFDVGTFYDLYGRNGSTAMNEAAVGAWVAALADKTQSIRTDMTYDFRGQLASTTTFTKVDSTGAGVLDGTQTVTRFVYDQAGQLLRTIAPRGEATASATDFTTSFSYDGLGRVLSSTDALGNATLTSYDDAQNKTITRLANGLATISAYDRAGQLMGVTQTNPLAQVLGETKYFYDANGRLRMTQDPTGVKQHLLYDESGRKIADIDGDGSLTEYIYNRDNQVVTTIAYATAANVALLVDSLGNPIAVTLSAVRPAAQTPDQAATAPNRITRNVYDTAHRLVNTIDEAGFVTKMIYDGASRVTEVIRYATIPIVPGQPQPGVPPGMALPPLPSGQQLSVADRHTRNFYDNDNLLSGTLDAEGFLVKHQYNAAGQRIETIAYATAMVDEQFANPIISDKDIHSYTLYNARGQVAGMVDGEGYLTEKVYDLNGNVTKSVRYANRVTYVAGASIAALRPVSTGAQVNDFSYTDLNQLASETNPAGVITQYNYDNVGNLISTVRAATSDEVRTLNARYDLQGRLTGELSGEGSALLTGSQTQAEIDAIWAAYGVKHAYDNAGRRISSTDAKGNKALFYYDQDGRLTHTINALGEVEERKYNALGQLSGTVQYGARISTTGLSGGLVNAALSTALNGIRNATRDSTTSLIYNATGTVQKVIDALGNDVTHAYNAFREEVSRSEKIDAAQRLDHTYTYDNRGLQTSTTWLAPGQPGSSVTTTYDAFGREKWVTDANGNAQTKGYDKLGRAVITIDRLNTLRTTSYDAFDRVLSQTDAHQNTTTYNYNTVARSMTMTTAEGISVTTVRNRHGEIESVTDGKNVKTLYAYDKNGNLVQVTDALGKITRNTYDRANLLIDAIDANLKTVRYSYDAANRVMTRQIDPDVLNLTTTYAYDAKGQRISVKDPNGVVTEFKFDLKGQLLSQTVDPTGLALTTSYTYDGRGKTLTVKSPLGVVTQYVYDNLGRRIEEHIDPTGLNLQRKYEYDKNNNVIAAIDANGNRTRNVYDQLDRLVYSIDALGNVTETDYDSEGVRVLRTAAWANPVNVAALPAVLTIDAMHYLINPVGGRDVKELFSYDRDGRLIYTLNTVGTLTKRIYDANGNVIERVTYANRLPTDSPLTPAIVAGYESGASVDPTRDNRTRVIYDALNRAVFNIDGNGAVVQQIYDNNGNVIERIAYATVIPTSTPANYAAVLSALKPNAEIDERTRIIYDNANRVFLSVDGKGRVTHQVYDANGNVVLRKVYAKAIPPGTPVSSVQWAIVPDPAHDSQVQMVYDAAGRLSYSINRVGPADGVVANEGVGAVTKYKYDANGNVIERIAYAKGIAAITPAFATYIEAAIQADAAHDQHVRMVYDEGNRMTYRVDGTGAATRNIYDAQGNVVERIDYARAISINSLSSTPSASEIIVAVTWAGDAAHDRHTRMVYDADNRLTYSVDASDAVTLRVYDAHNNVVQYTAYANRIASGASPNTNTVTSSSLDNITHFVYDGGNRLVYEIDALGFVKENTYDGLGNVLRVRAYDEPIATSGLLGSNNINVNTLSANIRTERRVYDANNNLVFTVDALGFIEAKEYDALGRVRTTRQYDTALAGLTLNVLNSMATPVSYVTAAAQALSNVATDRINSFEYDAAGRLIKSIDALNHSESFSYDALGNKLGFTNKNGALWTYEYDQASRLIAETGPASDTTTLIKLTDGSFEPSTGSTALVTRMEYDALGNVTKRTEAAERIFTFRNDPGRVLNLDISLPADKGFQNALLQNETMRKGWQAYAAGPMGNTGFKFTYKPAGYYPDNTQLSRDGFSGLEYFFNKITDFQAGATNSSWAEGTFTRGADDFATFVDNSGNAFTFRKSEGVLSVLSRNETMRRHWAIEYGITFEYRDAHYEPSDAAAYNTGVNAFNEFFTNDGLYPADGSILTVNGSQTWMTGSLSKILSPTGEKLGVFKYSYVDPALNAEARVTRYEYDAAGRQIKTMFPAVSVYDANYNSAATLADGLRHEAAKVALFSQVTYDAQGNAVVNLDVGGNYSYKVYDKSGRVRFEVDAEHYVVEYQRDAFGNATQLVRYAAALNFGVLGPRDGSVALSVEEVQAMLAAQGSVAHQGDRVLTSRYDQLGRVITVIEPLAFYYDSNAKQSGIPGTGTEGKTTSTTYNAFGQANSVAVSLSQYSGVARSYFYYNLRGDKTAEIDALGYLTTLQYDAAQNLTRRYESAQAIVGTWNVGGYPLDKLASLDDRETQYGYDLNNRKIIETRVNVENGLNAFGVAERSNLSTSYGYDYVGNLTSTTDASGAVTYSYYDALGRVIATAAPTRTMVVDGVAETLNPLTTFKLDAFGNVVERTEYAHGINATPGVFTPPGGAQAANRISRTLYDAHGHAIESIDAEGKSQFASYDAMGRLAKQWQPITAGGASTLAKAFNYDKLGRSVDVIEAGDGVNLIHHQARFNGFGELTAKGNTLGAATAGALAETFEYDNAGHLWRSNSGDGVTKVALYDQAGRTTAEIRSAEVNLNAFSDASSVERLGSSVQRSEIRYDLLGRVVEQIGPAQYFDNLGNFAFSSYDKVSGQDMSYIDYRITEDAFEAFFEVPQPAEGIGWMGGNLKRGAGDLAIYTAPGGAQYTFHKSDGLLKIAAENPTIRAGWEQQALDAFHTHTVKFYRDSGNYLPSNHTAFRELEKVFNLGFDNIPGTVTPQVAVYTQLRRFGGIFTKISLDQFKFVDANGATIYINRADSPLEVIKKSAVIRNGWEKEFGLTFVLDGGETIQRAFIKQSSVGTTQVRLDWTSLDVLGSGDVKVELFNNQNQMFKSVIFAASAANDGVALDIGTTALDSSITVVVSKKDREGLWKEVIHQSGIASASANPNAYNYGNILTIDAPSDPSVSVSLVVRQNGFLIPTTLINFGDALRFDASGLNLGNYDYQVFYSRGAVQTLHSTGKIAVTAAPLDPLAVSPYFASSGSSRLYLGNLGPGVKAFNYRRAEGYYTPSNIAAYNEIESLFNLYFDSTTQGQSRPILGGTLIRGAGDTATFIDPYGRSYAVSKSGGVLKAAREIEVIRNSWMTQYPGLTFDFHPAVGGYYPSDGVKFQSVEADFINAFNSIQIYGSISWLGGTLVKGELDSATFIDSSGNRYAFLKSDGALKVASESAVIRQAWADKFKLTFIQQSQAWSSFNVKTDGANYYVDFENPTQPLLDGAYEYELLYTDSNKPGPSAHATGTVNYTAQAVNPPVIQATFNTSKTAAGNTIISWAAAGTSGVPLFRYQPVGDIYWKEALRPAKDSLGNYTIELAPGTYNYELSYTSTANTNTVSDLIPIARGGAGTIKAYLLDYDYAPTTQVPLNKIDEVYNSIGKLIETFFTFPPGTATTPTATDPAATVSGIDNLGYPVGYFAKDGFFTFNHSEGVLGVAQRNTILRDAWESFYKVQFLNTSTGLAVDDPDKFITMKNDFDTFFRNAPGTLIKWAGNEIRSGNLIRGVTLPSGDIQAYFAAGGVYNGGVFFPFPTESVYTFNSTASVLKIVSQNDFLLNRWENEFHLDFVVNALPTFAAQTLETLLPRSAVYTNTNTTPNNSSPAQSTSITGGRVALVTEAAILDGPITPKTSQTLDRWGNVRSVTDARANTTNFTYNANNQVTKKEEPILVPSTDGSKVGKFATTQYYYDALGRQLATRDAAGYVNAVEYNAAGQVTLEKHADGGGVGYAYNAYGERIKMSVKVSDTQENVTAYTYDNLSRLISKAGAAVKVNAPSEYYAGTASVALYGTRNLIDSYLYDEAGRRIAVTNGAGETTRYQYDTRGNVVKLTQPAGQMTLTTWDMNNHQLQEIDANGNATTWSYDYFGKLKSRIVQDNAVSIIFPTTVSTTYGYQYDNAGQLTHQTSTITKNMVISAGQNLTTTYDAAGRVTSIEDSTLGSHTNYGYDLVGNKTSERFMLGDTVYQDNHLSYDALNRLSDAIDARHHVSFTYDAVGNRRNIKSVFYDDTDQVQQVDNWYTYDAMNRVKIENGRVVNGVIGIDTTEAAHQGVSYDYDLAGNRILAKQWGTRYDITGASGNPAITPNPEGAVTTRYHYDAQNRLTRTEQEALPGETVGWTYEHKNGGTAVNRQIAANLINERFYDAAGRVVVDFTANLGKQGYNVPTDGGDDRGDRVISSYDTNGRLVEQIAMDYKGGQRYWVDYGKVAGIYNGWDGYDAVGNLLRYHFKYRNDFDEYVTTAYAKGDGYREQSITKQHTEGSSTTNGKSNFAYDVNGNLQKVYNESDQSKNRRFVTDTNGAVLSRVDGLADNVTASLPLTVDGLRSVNAGSDIRIRHSMVVDGQTLGISGRAITDNNNPTNIIAPALKRFDFGAQSSGGLGSAPGSFMVPPSIAGQGLTNGLRAVAQAVYGDASLWYVIAEANGLNVDTDLKAGATLIIPTKVTTQNSLRTFKPYDPAEIKGENSPALPAPQGNGGGCGGAGTILIVIVAIVATVLTAGAAALAFSSVAGSLTGASLGAIASAGATALAGGSIGAAVIGGAVGSIVSQGVAIATGMQDSFSWRGVALGALGAGVTAGLGAAISSGAAPLLGGSSWQAVAGRAALSNTISQGIGVATGLQDSFSWSGVAAAAAGAGVGAAVGSMLGTNVPFDGMGPVQPAAFSNMGFAGDVLRGSISGFAAGTTTAALRGGRVSFTQVAADAFGNALGDSVVGVLGQGSQQETVLAGAQQDARVFGDANMRMADYRPNAIADNAYQQLLEEFGQPRTYASDVDPIILAVGNGVRNDASGVDRPTVPSGIRVGPNGEWIIDITTTSEKNKYQEVYHHGISSRDIALPTGRMSSDGLPVYRLPDLEPIRPSASYDDIADVAPGLMDLEMGIPQAAAEPPAPGWYAAPSPGMFQTFRDINNANLPRAETFRRYLQATIAPSQYEAERMHVPTEFGAAGIGALKKLGNMAWETSRAMWNPGASITDAMLGLPPIPGYNSPPFSINGPQLKGAGGVEFLASVLPFGGIRATGVNSVEMTLPNSTRGWKLGEPINNLTAIGEVPSWTSVRARYWKNESLYNAEVYSETNLTRMEAGLAPQRINPVTGRIESMELNHVPPQRDGGLFDVQKVWPDEHAAVDPFRRVKK